MGAVGIDTLTALKKSWQHLRSVTQPSTVDILVLRVIFMLHGRFPGVANDLLVHKSFLPIYK